MVFKNRWLPALLVVVLGLALLPGLSGISLGAEDPAAVAPPSGEIIKQSMSLVEVIQAGGWLMYVLGGMSVLGLALVFYFLVVLRQEQVVPREFFKDIQNMISAGRFEEARLASAKKPSPIAAITTAALDYTQRVENPDASLLKEIIEGEGSRQSTLIQNQIQYLLDIAVIAPMVGLLGTVMGMLQAFNTVALDLAKAKPMLLAAGVSMALITTVGGLLVGIPAMAAYAYFRGRVARLLSFLEIASADLLTLFIGKSRP